MTLTDSDKDLLLKAMCCVVAADGRVSGREITVIAEALTKAGFPATPEEIRPAVIELSKTIHEKGTSLYARDLAARLFVSCDRDVATALLESLDALVNADGRASKRESEIERTFRAATRQPPPVPESHPSQTVQAGGFLASLLDFAERRPLGVAVLLTGVALLGFRASLLVSGERRPIAPHAAATVVSSQVKAGGKHVVFDANKVMYHYNLNKSELKRIQVWNFGEIDLVEVDHQQNQRSGEVRDGKVVAQNAKTEIRKPVKIPHLTPGVFVGFENLTGRGDGVWIDFGDIQVCFEDSVSCAQVSGVLADGARGWSADALNNDDRSRASKSIRVRVDVADKDGRKESETWDCEFRDPRTNDKPSEFLVYKGGIRRDEEKVEEREERRASGRVVE